VRLLVVLALLVGALAAWSFVLYGTVRPCEALRVELTRQAALGAGVPHEGIGHPAFAEGPAPRSVDRGIAPLSALECAGRLIQAQFGEVRLPVPPEPAPPAETGPARHPEDRFRAMVGEIQQHLHGLGYDAGPVDGEMRQATGHAIEAWERDNGREVTGQPSAALLRELRSR